jgi:subtilisin family serine protease
MPRLPRACLLLFAALAALLVPSLSAPAPANAADSLWAAARGLWALGHRGQGVRLAVLDSGLAAGHPAFASSSVEAVEDATGEGQAGDAEGHGTHVAGVVGDAYA